MISNQMTARRFIRNSKVLFCMLGAVLGVYTLVLMYGDIWITHHHTLNFLDCLFSGRFMDFYKVSVENQFSGFPANYYVTFYVIFGIWELPLWLLIRFASVDQMAIGCMIWLKLFVVLFSCGCGFWVYRITKKVTQDETRAIFALFLTLSSLCMAVPAFAVAQYDVVSLFFVLWGLDTSVEEDGISLKTVLIFSFAATLKIFALFAFAFLVLLKEKRILCIFRDMLGGLAGLALVMLPWIGDEYFKIAISDFNGRFVDAILALSLPGGASAILPFVACLFAICVIAYASRAEGPAHFLQLFSWLNFFFYAALFAFVLNAHPYWIVLMVPYGAFLISGDDKNLKLNMTLSIAMEASIIVVHAYLFNYVYLANTAFAVLLMRDVPVFRNVLQADNMWQLITTLGLDKYIPVLFTLFVVCAGSLLVINHPWKRSGQGNALEAPEVYTVRLASEIVRLVPIAVYFILVFLITYFI